MIDPYQVLGLTHDADEAEIRRCYLELVKRFPPEREPQRFAEIREAYDLLRDPVTSLERRIFSLQSSQAFDRLTGGQQRDVRAQRLRTDSLLSLGEP